MVSYPKPLIGTNTDRVPEFKDKKSAESFSKLILEFSDVGIELGERTLWELYKAYPCPAHENDG